MLKFVGLGGRLVFDTRLGVVIKLKCTLFRLLKIFKEDPSEASCYSSAAKENGTKTECLGVCLDFFWRVWANPAKSLKENGGEYRNRL